MSIGTATKNDEVTILSRAIDPANGSWPVEVAQGILSIALSQADRQRMDELAAKARSATLDADEELEIESYRQASRLLELMKAKARASVARINQTH
ncbi:MAG: hypothetical protein JWL69_3211 [Phycisphaerales bacterium]|jgi:uncharacterized protein YnzC (UPF0291/DUF896 family)|nr:hypothetical protein [Phycisphaerales bacterium]